MATSKVARPLLARVIADLADTTSEKDLAYQAAAYMISEGRTSELKSLMRDVKQFRSDNSGIIEVVAVSAFKLTDPVKAEIKKLVLAATPEAKKIILSERIDESVIGGVRLELANRQLDLTIREKLRTFKNYVTASKSGVN